MIDGWRARRKILLTAGLRTVEVTEVESLEREGKIMQITELLDQYAAGPALLRAAVGQIDRDKLRLRPVPGRWSTLEVVCHLSDAEAVYAERMKRVLAEDEPPLRGFDPDIWGPRLAYHQRDLDEELQLIKLLRDQMLRILRPLTSEEFERRGIHLEDGPMTLEVLLRRITGHVPHHMRFIEEKRAALAQP
ncbi:MAG TPA: DinB family protein [Pirellulales bacterium]|jgi:hypothetical protein|nr:DinB family protein [Pirellulales bacterium]